MLARGDGERIAFIDDAGPCTRGELARRVRNFAGALRGLGVTPGVRMLLCAEDSIDFVVACLGAIWAGVVPVMVNPQLGTDDYRYLLDDSGAGLLAVSAAAWVLASARSLLERSSLRRLAAWAFSITAWASAGN